MIKNFLKNLIDLNKEKFDYTTQNYYNNDESELKAQKIEIQEINKPNNKADYYHPKPGSRITSFFGDRLLIINGEKLKRFHAGIDFGGKAPVYAVEDSIVEKILLPDYQYPCKFVYSDRGWVNATIPDGRAWTPYAILIGKFTKTKYKYIHVDCSSIKVGEHIPAGRMIGICDNLGFSMGPHLHFETWMIGKNNKYNYPDNPITVLKRFGIKP